MTTLTNEQIRQLNSYSVYVDKPHHPVFSLEDLLGHNTELCLTSVRTVSGCPNDSVTASFFMRRYGMFMAMQLTNLTMYDEIWQGSPDRLVFGATVEYGNRTVSTYVEAADWQPADDHTNAIRSILLGADKVIGQLRTVTSVSPLTLWENIFGFLLWQYHVLLQNPATAKEACEDMNILKDDRTWVGIASCSRFATYLNGKEPSDLLNTTARTTCCFSKDVPGLIQCGFCPLK